MAKIIGKIIAQQGVRYGSRPDGSEWRQCQYVIEDASHQGEGVVVSTFSRSIMDQIGRKTNGELTVEADYIPGLRHWDGRRKDGTMGEARYDQENRLTSLTILRGTAANSEQPQEQQAPAQTAAQAPAQQPRQNATGDDLPF